MDQHEFASPTEKSVLIRRVSTAEVIELNDTVVVEEPMEIRVVHGPVAKRVVRSLSITMRTPGHDQELAAGFLFSESILQSADQIQAIEFRGVSAEGALTGNIVRIHLRPDVELDMGRLRRNFLTTSSCGVCGKASLESLQIKGLPPN